MLKMLKIDSSIFLQNINMPTRQLFLLFEKSTTFRGNPRTCIIQPCKTDKMEIVQPRVVDCQIVTKYSAISFANFGE